MIWRGSARPWMPIAVSPCFIPLFVSHFRPIAVVGFTLAVPAVALSFSCFRFSFLVTQLGIAAPAYFTLFRQPSTPSPYHTLFVLVYGTQRWRRCVGALTPWIYSIDVTQIRGSGA